MIVLREYEYFYNTHRAHRTLNQAAPLRPLPDGVNDLDLFNVSRKRRSVRGPSRRSPAPGSLATRAECRASAQPGHSLMPPSPVRIMYFWNTKKMIATGMVIASAAAS